MTLNILCGSIFATVLSFEVANDRINIDYDVKANANYSNQSLQWSLLHSTALLSNLSSSSAKNLTSIINYRNKTFQIYEPL